MRENLLEEVPKYSLKTEASHIKLSLKGCFNKLFCAAQNAYIYNYMYILDINTFNLNGIFISQIMQIPHTIPKVKVSFRLRKVVSIAKHIIVTKQ